MKKCILIVSLLLLSPLSANAQSCTGNGGIGYNPYVTIPQQQQPITYVYVPNQENFPMKAKKATDFPNIDPYKQQFSRDLVQRKEHFYQSYSSKAADRLISAVRMDLLKMRRN